MKSSSTLHAAIAALLLAAPASPAFAREVPENLVPPPSQVFLFDLRAEGAQVYECAEGKAGFEWAFRGPDATLTEASGKPAGRHYGGPTWEALDGSKVVGEVAASAPSEDADSITQLLLKAKSHAGEGRFAKVVAVQRLQTRGGKAPAAGCTQDKVGKQYRSAYSARYYFYGDKS